MIASPPKNPSETKSRLGQYKWARWYDAEVGRWISEDPIGFAAGDANLARYVGNGSTGHSDPSGFDDVAKIGTGGILLQGTGADGKVISLTVEITKIDVKTGMVDYVYKGQNLSSHITILIPTDQQFVLDLAKVPPNIHLHPQVPLTETDAQTKATVVAMVDAISDLATTATGKEILDGITAVNNGTNNNLPNTTPIPIVPATTVSPKTGKPDSWIETEKLGGKLNPDFKPKIHYNPNSKAPGMGKELWHAWGHIKGKYIGPSTNDTIKWDIEGLKWKKKIEDELKGKK